MINLGRTQRWANHAGVERTKAKLAARGKRKSQVSDSEPDKRQPNMANKTTTQQLSEGDVYECSVALGICARRQIELARKDSPTERQVSVIRYLQLRSTWMAIERIYGQQDTPFPDWPDDLEVAQ